MKFKRYHLTALLFLFITSTLFAQMSDQQVIDELRRYQNSGLSQEQIATEMVRKGVSPTQLQRLRSQYNVTEGAQESS